MVMDLQYFGGWGASSGISENGKPYGSEYTTVYETGNIKFVMYNDGSATAPMETMTKGRVYVTINAKNEIKSISFYDKKNGRYKQVDRGHFHMVNGKKLDPHTHKGYWHDEKGTYELSPKEAKMFDRVQKIWYYHLSRK